MSLSFQHFNDFSCQSDRVLKVNKSNSCQSSWANHTVDWSFFLTKIKKIISLISYCAKFLLFQPFFKTEHKMQHTKLYICKLRFCGNWQVKSFNYIPFCSNMLSFTKEGYTIIANIILFVISYKKLPWIFLQKKSQIMICTFNVKYGFNCFEWKLQLLVRISIFFSQTQIFLCANKIKNLQCLDITSNYNLEFMPSSVFHCVVIHNSWLFM